MNDREFRQHLIKLRLRERKEAQAAIAAVKKPPAIAKFQKAKKRRSAYTGLLKTWPSLEKTSQSKMQVDLRGLECVFSVRSLVVISHQRIFFAGVSPGGGVFGLQLPRPVVGYF